MRRIMACIAIIIALMVAYSAGNRDGVRHAIMDARISEDSNGMYTLELDGQVYEYLP